MTAVSDATPVPATPFASPPSAPGIDDILKNEPAQRSWTNSRWLTAAALVVFFPLGLLLMWKRRHFKKSIRWGLTALAVLLTISIITTGSGGYLVGDAAVSTDQYWESIARLNGLDEKAAHTLNRAGWDVAAAQNGRVSFRDLTASINALSLAGMRGRDQLLAFAPSVAMLAKISGRNVDQVGKDLVLLNRRQGLTKDEVVATMLTLFNISEKQSVSPTAESKRACFESLANALHVHADLAVPWIQSLSNEEKRSALQNLAHVQSVIAKALGDDAAGAKFSQLLARAVSSDAESFDKIGRATGFTLGDAGHVQRLLLTTAGTQQILDSLKAVAAKLSK